jgi:hypothetical protein
MNRRLAILCLDGGHRRFETNALAKGVGKLEG